MPLAVECFEIMANCYVVRAESGASEAVVIDPGGGAADLQRELARTGARCAGILVTHADVDHVSGVADLAEGTAAPVYAPDPTLMPEVRAQGAGFFPPPRPYEVTRMVAGGTGFSVAGIDFEVVDVPGHSPDHVAFHAEDVLFAGDLLMQGTVGRTDFPGGDWETLLASIRTLLDRFPPETTVYPGHGPPTTLAEELDRNPFLSELRAAAP